MLKYLQICLKQMINTLSWMVNKMTHGFTLDYSIQIASQDLAAGSQPSPTRFKKVSFISEKCTAIREFLCQPVIAKSVNFKHMKLNMRHGQDLINQVS